MVKRASVRPGFFRLDHRQPVRRFSSCAGVALILVFVSYCLLAPTSPLIAFSEFSEPRLKARNRLAFSYYRAIGSSLNTWISVASAKAVQESEQKTLSDTVRQEGIPSIYPLYTSIQRAKGGAPIEVLESTDAFGKYDPAQDALGSNIAGVMLLRKQAGFPSCRFVFKERFSTVLAFNLDAFSKVSIIDHVLAVSLRFAPWKLLNKGGDLCVWGDEACVIGTADRQSPVGNLTSLFQVPLNEAIDHEDWLEVAVPPVAKCQGEISPKLIAKGDAFRIR